MSSSDRTFPRSVLYGAGAVLLVAMSLTFVSRKLDVGTVHAPEATAISARDVRFVDLPNGAVAAYDATTGAEAAVFAPGTNGFVRGVLRGMARERKLEAIGPAPSYRLTRWADGRLSIEDPITRRHVDLGAFGRTNSEVFAKLLIER